MTKELFNFNYNISADVLSSVEDFYPGLNDNEAQTLAAEIVNNFDYSVVYNQILHDLEWYAKEQGIELIDKDVPHEVSHLTAI